MDLQAIATSIRLAAWTTGCLLVLGMPIAYWLSFTRWRLRPIVEAVVALPLVLPPTVLGFYLLVALGPESPLGATWASLTGHLLPFSFGGLVVASVIYSLPFAVQPFTEAFSSVDRRLIEAAWCLGASRFGTFYRVIVPLSVRGIITGMVLSFAHTLGEFGVVLMVGGNRPGETRTASIAIYDDVQAMDYAAAGRTAIFLLVTSVVVLAVAYGLRRGVWKPWAQR